MVERPPLALLLSALPALLLSALPVPLHTPPHRRVCGSPAGTRSKARLPPPRNPLQTGGPLCVAPIRHLIFSATRTVVHIWREVARGTQKHECTVTAQTSDVMSKAPACTTPYLRCRRAFTLSLLEPKTLTANTPRARLRAPPLGARPGCQARCAALWTPFAFCPACPARFPATAPLMSPVTLQRCWAAGGPQLQQPHRYLVPNPCRGAPMPPPRASKPPPARPIR